MSGKHLFTGDRFLRAADSSTSSKFDSNLLNLGEDDNWVANTPSSANSDLWSLQRCGGARDHFRHVGGTSMMFDAAEEEATVHRRHVGWTTVETMKSAPMSVPGWQRMGGSVEAEGEEEDWVPPHEYVTRVHGKTAVATSVFEGVGRTLKGRDMSQVRDTIWSRTGFFG